MTTPNAGIVDQAFRFAELTPPSSLDDESPKALAANGVYETAVELVLAREDWGFARRYRILALTDGDTGLEADPDLPNVYRLSSDCVRLRAVRSAGAEWRMEGDFVRSDVAAGLPVLMTIRDPDESKYPALVRVAISYQIAVLLAPEFVKARTKRNDLKSDLADAVNMAMAEDRVTASQQAWRGGSLSSDWVEVAQQ